MDYPEDLGLDDVNRDGDVTNADKVRRMELFSGTDTTQVWLNDSLPGRA